jgi:hypothetical protein
LGNSHNQFVLFPSATDFIGTWHISAGVTAEWTMIWGVLNELPVDLFVLALSALAGSSMVYNLRWCSDRSHCISGPPVANRGGTRLCQHMADVALCIDPPQVSC